SLLARVLSSLPRQFARIGFELGREHSLRMPVVQFLELREQIRGSELVNGSPCLWEIHMIKTEAEVAPIRYVCELASDAYAAVPKLVRIGDTEREACRKLRIDIAQ